VQAAAQAAWAKELSRITIEGVSPADQRRFATALYHSAIQPRNRTADRPDEDRARPSMMITTRCGTAIAPRSH
jgi:putative alpha-1,2-mannosidase